MIVVNQTHREITNTREQSRKEQMKLCIRHRHCRICCFSFWWCLSCAMLVLCLINYNAMSSRSGLATHPIWILWFWILTHIKIHLENPPRIQNHLDTSKITTPQNPNPRESWGSMIRSGFWPTLVNTPETYIYGIVNTEDYRCLPVIWNYRYRYTVFGASLMILYLRY